MTRKPDEWMPLHIGAYHADTTHLTRDQHGAYLLLLMAYWRRGSALPADDARLGAIVKASAAEWRKLRPVLREFFTETDGHWHQGRADEELAKAYRLTEAKAAAGAAGGRTKWQHPPDRAAEHAKTRSQRLAAAREKGTHTNDEWDAMVSVFNGCCVRCASRPEKPFKDHIIPIYLGGSDGLENLQPLCPSCNSSKGPEETDHRQNALHDWRERLAKCLADAKQMPAPLPSPKPEHTSLRSVSPPKASKPRTAHPKTEPEGFAEFYQAYPRKEARPSAAKAYAAALARAKPEALLDGAKRYALSRTDEDPKFTKHPATWLNNDCWMDQEVSHETSIARGRGRAASGQRTFIEAGASLINELRAEARFAESGDDNPLAIEAGRPLLPG